MSLKYSVAIAEPVRTAVGTFGDSLKDIRPSSLEQHSLPPPSNGLAATRGDRNGGDAHHHGRPEGQASPNNAVRKIRLRWRKARFGLQGRSIRN